MNRTTYLVKGHSEASVYVVSMEQGDSHDPPHEVEVGEMVRVDPRVGVDLESVDVLPAVLEQTVVWVQHLMREEVEPLSRHSAVVQTLLALELHHQPLPHVLRPHLDNLPVTVLEDLGSRHLEAAVARGRLEAAQLRAEDLHLGHEVPLGLGEVVLVRGHLQQAPRVFAGVAGGGGGGRGWCAG